MPITLSNIPNTAIKLRWKEPYASAALNKKVAAIVPAGIYRGLRLEESATDLSVDVVEDVDNGDHVAVYESIDGFSTTYRDDTSGRITLDLSSFSSGVTVILSLFVEYALFAETTADLRGYTQAEFDALSSAERAEAVVIGTVLRSASGVIPSANITHDGRKIPFLNRSNESVPWNPMIRNGGFELGDTGDTYVHASPFWEASAPDADRTVGPVDVDASSGDKCLEVEALAAGTINVSTKQTLYMPVVPGRQIRIRLYKKAVQAATGSLGTVRLSFEDKDRANDTNVDLNFDIDAIDGDFVRFDGVIIIPADMAVVKTFEVIVSGTYGSAGPCIRFDDVQVWCEVDAEDWLITGSSVAAEVETDALFIGDRAATTGAAKITFSDLDLDGVYNVLVERRDQNSALASPGLEWIAPTSDVAANSAALIVPAGVTAGIEYTLIHQSVPGTEKGHRTYVTPIGTIVRTTNASYNNVSGNWTKDVSADRAAREDFSEGFTTNRFKQGGTSVWADSLWQMGQSFDRFGVLDKGIWNTWTQPWFENGTDYTADPAWDKAGNVVNASNPGGDINSVGVIITAAGASLKTQDTISIGQTGQIMIMDISVEPYHTFAVDDFEWRVGFARGTDMRTATNYIWLRRPPLVDASDTYLIEAADTFGGAGTESIDTGVVVPSSIPHSLRVRIEVIGSDFDEGYRSNFYIDGVLIGSLIDDTAVPAAGVGAGFSSGATGSESVRWGAMSLTWNVQKV
jgi:hypothetical protein